MSFEIASFKPSQPIEGIPSPSAIRNIDTFFEEYGRGPIDPKENPRIGFHSQSKLLPTEEELLEDYFLTTIIPRYSLPESGLRFKDWIRSSNAAKSNLGYLETLNELVISLRPTKNSFFQMPDGPMKQRSFEELENRFNQSTEISNVIRDFKTHGSEASQGKLLIGDSTSGAIDIAAAFARLSWLQLGHRHIQGMIGEFDKFTQTKQKWPEDDLPQLPDPYDVAYLRFDDLSEFANNNGVNTPLLSDLGTRKIVVITGYDHVGDKSRAELLRQFIDIRCGQRPAVSNTTITSALPLDKIYPVSMYPGETIYTAQRTLKYLMDPVMMPGADIRLNIPQEPSMLYVGPKRYLRPSASPR